MKPQARPGQPTGRKWAGAILAACLCLLVSSCASAFSRGVERTPSPVVRVGWSIQVGSFAEVKNAETLAASLRRRGIEAFYFRNDKGFYAVRFGDFPTRQAAEAKARGLAKVIGAWFIAPPGTGTLPAGGSATARPPALLPGNTSAPVPNTPSALAPDKPAALSPASDAEMGVIAARTAERFIGIPYKWGGNTVPEGLDCSGFTRAVYYLCGVSIPRVAGDQYRAGLAVTRDELKEGDLVFFGASQADITHVGIYVGNGRFVHAPKRGDDIKISSLDEDYFQKKFVGGRRYF
jgi:cell wall-associated NlpC family hydrolase